MEDAMKLIAAATIALTLGACAGAGTAVTRYGAVQPVSFVSEGTTYRVYDKPADGRMMITPSIADSAGWYARSYMFDPALEFAAAAQSFVAGRGCHVTNAAALIGPQFEVSYSC